MITEEQYIKTKALGTVTAAINVLKDLVPENLEGIIEDGEMAKVANKLHLWQERLFKEVNIQDG